MLRVNGSSRLLYLHDCSLDGSLVVLVGDWSPLLSYFRAGFGYCSFFLVVQAFVRFPNLPLVVGFWSAVSFRSAKGCAVVVDPVSG